MKEYKLQKPNGEWRTIEEADLPQLVLVDRPNDAGLFGWGIHAHQNGMFTHAMWAYRVDAQGRIICISQELTLRDRPLDHWLDGKHYLKFWYNPTWTFENEAKLIRKCKRDLKRGWVARLYDGVGIVGQAIGYLMPIKPVRKLIRMINIPFLNYCSENAGEKLRIVEHTFRMRHPSPKDLNRWCYRQAKLPTSLSLNSPRVFGRIIPQTM